MGLFSLKVTCWKILLLLSTAAVCSYICVSQTRFIQVIGCLTLPSPHPFFLSRPVCLDVPFEVSQKALIADMLGFDLTDGRKQKFSLPQCPLEVVIPLVFSYPWYVPICAGTFWYTAMKLCGHLGWRFSGFILCNNLIAIWYSSSAHCLNLLRCFAWLLWCFLYLC